MHFCIIFEIYITSFGKWEVNMKLFKNMALIAVFFVISFVSAQGREIAPVVEHVAMRDGVLLYTRVYFPKDMKEPVSTILLRTPYCKPFGKFLTQVWQPFAESNGYAFVIQAVRGTERSLGQINPLIQEFPDGRDTVKWIFRQKWSNKKIATVGSSYDGFTALAAAHIPKREKAEEGYVSVVIADGYPIHSFSSWPMSIGGVPKWDSLWWWSAVLKGNLGMLQDLRLAEKATNLRPINELDWELFHEKLSVWQEWIRNIDSHSSYWEKTRFGE